MQEKEAVSGRTGTLRGQETVPEHSGSLQREEDESQEEEEEGGLTGCHTHIPEGPEDLTSSCSGTGKGTRSLGDLGPKQVV